MKITNRIEPGMKDLSIERPLHCSIVTFGYAVRLDTKVSPTSAVMQYQEVKENSAKSAVMRTLTDSTTLLDVPEPTMNIHTTKKNNNAQKRRPG